MTPLQLAYDKLLKIRKSKDLKLRKAALLRDTIALPDGREVPLDLRYYQVQGVLHLCVMDRFLLGDDTGTGKCVNGASLVRTNNGLKKIKDLRLDSLGHPPSPETFEAAQDLEVWTGFRWAKIKRFYYEGVRPSIKLLTNRGYMIEGSLRHPIQVRDALAESWVRLPDLKGDEYICIERRPLDRWPEHDAEIPTGTRGFRGAKSYPLPARLSPPLAALLGYYVSEGNRSPGGLTITQHHQEAHAHIRQLFLEVFGWQGNEDALNRETTICVSSVALKDFFERCGAASVLSADKRIPPPILGCTKPTVRAFLQALFEGDGSVDERQSAVEYSSKSMELIQDLQVLLLQFGILSSRLPKEVDGQTFWRLQIYGEDARSFQREIGFYSSRKNDTLTRLQAKTRNDNLDLIPHTKVPVERLWKRLVAATAKQGSNANRKGSGIKPFGDTIRNTVMHIIHGRRKMTYPKLRELLGLCERYGLAYDFDYLALLQIEKNHFFYDPIQSLEPGECELMDLEIDHKDHSFVANGLVNHNTLMAITALCHLWSMEPNVKAIILTDKSVVPQWAREFGKFCHIEELCILQCVGSPAQRKKIYDQFNASEKPTALILTYATARRDVDTLLTLENFSLICDEATAFKETKSQNYKVVFHMAKKCRRMWALTATLLKNRLTEGYGIYSILMPGLFPTSKSKFIDEYCITRMQRIGNKQIPIVLGPRKTMVPVFREKIDPYYLGRAKMDVAAELPPLTMREHYVVMSPEQQAKYAEALQGFLVREKTDVENSEINPLTAVLYCQQIVNHLSLVDCEGPSAKFDALFEILEEGDLANEKVIVFSRFEKMITLIETEAKRRKIKVVRITGAEDSKQRDASQEAFMNPDSGVQVCLITTAAEQGINLQCAKAIIFYDTPWSAGTYLQILGRMIRIGSTQDHCYAIHLVVKRSVDTRVMLVLQQKYQLLEEVLGRRIKGADDDEVFVSQNNDISQIYKSLAMEFGL